MHCGQSSMSAMAAKASTSGGGNVVTDVSMDPTIWSSLQNDLLRKVFGKLPFREFFQLRVVCKEWNRQASDQRFLEASCTELTPKPYFVVASHSPVKYVARRYRGSPTIRVPNRLLCHGLLSYDASSQRWNWTRLPLLSITGRGGYSAVEGLIYCSDQVINLHTRVFHALPPPPEPWKFSLHQWPYFGMTLDRSESSSTFQIIFGRKTESVIYSSKTNSWTHIGTEDESDLHGPGRGSAMSVSSCACCNGFMYVARRNFYGGVDVVMRYDLERRIWGSIRLDREPSDPLYSISGGTSDFFVGAWQGHLLGVAIREDRSGTGEGCVKVWELHTYRSEHRWTEVASMPKDQFKWLINASDEPKGDHVLRLSELQSGYISRYRFHDGCSFCGEYVLVYDWRDEGLVDQMRFVVCRLDSEDLTRSVWQKVEL